MYDIAFISVIVCGCLLFAFQSRIGDFISDRIGNRSERGITPDVFQRVKNLTDEAAKGEALRLIEIHGTRSLDCRGKLESFGPEFQNEPLRNFISEHSSLCFGDREVVSCELFKRSVMRFCEVLLIGRDESEDFYYCLMAHDNSNVYEIHAGFREEPEVVGDFFRFVILEHDLWSLERSAGSLEAL